MPESLAAEARGMAAAFGLVAAAAGPPAALLGWLAARRGYRLVPAWKPPERGWTGFDAALLFVACMAARHMFGLVGGVALLPVGFVAFRVWRRAATGHVPPLDGWRLAADLALGVRTWVWLAPVALATHFAAVGVLSAAGGGPDEHPLTHTDVSDPWAVASLFVTACVVAAAYEEFGFRRVLVPWAMGRRYRPWLLIPAAAVAAWFANANSPGKLPGDVFPPLCLLAGLAVGLFAVVKGRRAVPRFPERTAAAAWATAAVFALVHPVWPTPVPLFVFAVGLGCSVARTGQVTSAVVAHGLLNATSAVYLLRGGT